MGSAMAALHIGLNIRLIDRESRVLTGDVRAAGAALAELKGLIERILSDYTAKDSTASPNEIRRNWFADYALVALNAAIRFQYQLPNTQRRQWSQVLGGLLEQWLKVDGEAGQSLAFQLSRNHLMALAGQWNNEAWKKVEALCNAMETGPYNECCAQSIYLLAPDLTREQRRRSASKIIARLAECMPNREWCSQDPDLEPLREFVRRHPELYRESATAGLFEVKESWN